MITVMMGVEREANRLVGQGLDFRNDFLRAGRKVRVDDQHIVLEHNPAIVAMAVAFDVAFVKVNVRRDLLGLVDFGDCATRPSQDGQARNEKYFLQRRFHGADNSANPPAGQTGSHYLVISETPH